MYYAAQPIEIRYFSQTNKEKTLASDVFAKQIACGENFSLAVSTKGDVYSWGLATFGQLGINLQRGMISNVIDKNG